MAGVSKGTVDRVLHNRGDVSQENQRKIQNIIEQIGYRPNLFASMLASKRSYTIAVLFPHYMQGEYWELVDNGVKQSEARCAEFNTKISLFCYDQFSLESFADACRRLIESEPNAVILAPMYHEPTLKLVSWLSSKRIPYIYIDSKIDEPHYAAYYGISMHQSGLLAASLLFAGGAASELVNIRIERHASEQDNPTLRRREGFYDYLASHYPNTVVHEHYVKPYDCAHNRESLDRFFADHPGVNHIVTFNSRIHLVASYLRDRGVKDKTVVGFDKLPLNMVAVSEGLVNYLIVQRTENQLTRAVDALLGLLHRNISPSVRDNNMSLDILVKENVDFYIEF